MKFEIPLELLQAVVNFLVKQQYAEVFQLVAALQTLKEVKEPEKVE